jgi:uncharacterized membrane protein YeaQ/YmgE (transglycosylase-associated protein family)
MYNVRHLSGIVMDGFSDMRPALRRTFNGDRDDDRLDRLFGAYPRLTVVAVIVGGLVAGNVLAHLPATGIAANYISYPAILIGAVYALRTRHYLFGDKHACEDDFAWLAGALIPAAAALVFVAFSGRFFGGDLPLIPNAPEWTGIGAILVATADSLSIAAAVTIAMAALCFSRDWKKAFRDLAVRLLVFKISVFIMVLLLVDIGIVGAVLGTLIESVFGVDIPDWLGELFDQFTYAGLMSLIYLAIIGAAWSVCRQKFGQLLELGEVDVIAAIADHAANEASRDDRVTNRPG